MRFSHSISIEIIQSKGIFPCISIIWAIVRTDRRANNSEVVNARAALSADRNVRLQGLSLPSDPLLIPNTREWNIVSNFRTYEGRGRELRARLYIDMPSVVYPTPVIKEGCGVREGLRVRGECEVGQRRWNGVATDHVKTKSWYFSCCVKVSIGETLATRLFFVVSNWWMCLDAVYFREVESFSTRESISCEWKGEREREIPKF